MKIEAVSIQFKPAKVTFSMEMTLTEIRMLKDMMQNPIYDYAGDPIEDEEEEMIRQSLFMEMQNVLDIFNSKPAGEESNA